MAKDEDKTKSEGSEKQAAKASKATKTKDTAKKPAAKKASPKKKSSPAEEPSKIEAEGLDVDIDFDELGDNLSEDLGEETGSANEKAASSSPAPKSKAKTKKYKFAVGQDVVYPLQGVGRITDQVEKAFKGENISYFVIFVEATEMTLMLPVAKVSQLGLRPIVEKSDAEKALKSMSDKNEPLTSDWKQRYQNNLDLLKLGGIMEIATVVRSLYHRSKVKELPILERKLYDNALKLMVDEVSLALSMPKDEIEDLLHNRLENST